MCPAGGQASHVTEEAGASGHKQKRLVSACVSSRDWQLERPDSGALTDKPCSAQTHVLHQPRKNGIPPDYGDWVLKAHPQLWGGACQHKCHTGSNGVRIQKAERPHPLLSGCQVHQTPLQGCSDMCHAGASSWPQACPWRGVSGKGLDHPCLAAVPVEGHATLAHKTMELQRRPKESCGVSLNPVPFSKPPTSGFPTAPPLGRRHKAAETQLRRNWHVAPSGPRADQVPMTYEPPSARVSHANCLPRSRTAGLKLCALRHVARVAWPGTGNKTQCVRESTSPSPVS